MFCDAILTVCDFELAARSGNESPDWDVAGTAARPGDVRDPTG
ncbi:hypothetical protein [Frankia sp. CiP3]|nr:hypothetical protein [Frankia sp. CiP3]